MSCPQHTKNMFDPKSRALLVPAIAKAVRGVDALVVCGQSGIIPGVLVSELTNIPLVIVRKPGEPVQAGRSHLCNFYTEEAGPFKTWAFIDDLISTGDTYAHVVWSLLKEHVTVTALPTRAVFYTQCYAYEKLRTLEWIADNVAIRATPGYASTLFREERDHVLRQLQSSVECFPGPTQCTAMRVSLCSACGERYLVYENESSLSCFACRL